MPRLTALLVGLALAAGLGAVSSGAAAPGAPAPRNLPFRTIARATFVGESEAGRPRVAIAATRAQVLSRIGPVEHGDLARVRRTDVRRFVVVGVFGGVDWTCCGQLTIRRLSARAGQLCVVAVRRPAGDGGAPSQPYQVVAVRRTLLRLPLPRAWRLVRPDGRTIAASRGARRC